jgi:hypothetical protein
VRALPRIDLQQQEERDSLFPDVDPRWFG